MDQARIDRNVEKMRGLGAPPEDIEAYLREEGVGSTPFYKRAGLGTSDQDFFPQFNKNVAEAIGFIPQVGYEAVRGVGNLLGADTEGRDIPREVAGGMRRAGIATADPRVKPQSVAARAGDIAGQTAEMALPLAGALKVVSKGTGAAALLAKDMMEFAAKHPVKAAVADALSTFGSALGGKAGYEGSGGNPNVEAVGEVLGGLAAPFTAAGGAVGAGYRKARSLNPISENMAERKAAARLKQVVPDLEEAKDALRQETISNLTPAQRIKTDEAYALEKSARLSDAKTNREMQLRDTSNQEQLMHEAQILGEGGNPRDVVRVLEARKKALLEKSGKRAAQATTQSAQDIERMMPRVASEDASITASGELDSAAAAARAKSADLWSRVPDAPVSPAKTKEVVTGTLSSLPRAQHGDVPAVLRQYELKNVESIKELQGLRSELLRDAREARAAGNFNRARIGSDVADAVLEDMLSVKGASKPLQDALAFSRWENDTFRKGTVGKLLGSDKLGADRVPAEITLRTAVGSGGDRGAAAVDELRMAADTPEMQDALEQYIRGEAAKKIGPTGRLSPTGAHGWQQRNEAIIKRFPGVGQDVQTALGSQAEAERLVSRHGELQQSLTTSNRSMTARILNTPVGKEADAILGAKDPRGAAKAAMALVRRDPKAVAGLKSAMVEKLLSNAAQKEVDEFGQTVASGNKLFKSLMDTRARAAAEEVLGKASVLRLERISRELEAIQKSAGVGKSAEGLVSPPSTLLAAFVRHKALTATAGMREGLGAGGLSAASSVTRISDALLSKFSGGKAQQIVIEAMQDRDLYEALLQDIRTPKGQQQALKKLNLWMAGVATRQRDYEEQQ